MSSLFETITNKNVVSGNEKGTLQMWVNIVDPLLAHNFPFPCLPFFFYCNFLSSTKKFPS